MADRSHLIFISYRGSDQNWATELVYARMTEAFGRRRLQGRKLPSGRR